MAHDSSDPTEEATRIQPVCARDGWSDYVRRVRGRELADLRWHWGDAYEFSWAAGLYQARRRDTGDLLACSGVRGLLGLVRADYVAKPVSCEAQPAPEPDEFPQAIADDYPGWTVEHQDGRWTASCPAVTVHAACAAALRVLIEQAISGGDPDWDDPA